MQEMRKCGQEQQFLKNIYMPKTPQNYSLYFADSLGPMGNIVSNVPIIGLVHYIMV